MKQKQKGVVTSGLIMLMIALGIAAGWVAEQASKKRIQDNANSFYNRVIYLRNKIHAYNNDQYQNGWGINTASIFPANLGQLEGRYIPACSTSDNNAGICQKYNQTPWGFLPSSAYRVVGVPAGSPEYYRAEITFTLPSKTSSLWRSERRANISLLSRLPNVVYSESANTVKLIVDRPDKAFAYNSLVKRSGDDSTLIDDWDVGGTAAITNVRDMTIRNSDGSQKAVANKLTEIYTVKHGDTINLPKCPSGLAPETNLTVSEINPTNGYVNSPNYKPYILNKSSTTLTVGLDVIAVDTAGTKVKIHNGLVTVFIQCK